ncbi:MAG: polysaccharide deacetylase family protein [Bacteroidales bacterium]|jgi:peptidoglycan/xylan/chitin deacetylase (PgdA/CDA1 family)|nr:polysaccharide deacetylase family protein [Bacteroidales bacterium]
MLNKIPDFIQNTPWQNHLWRIPTTEKVLYLTFDDGPTPVVTNETLEILDAFNAKASFFCLGRNAEHHPDLVENIIRKGHRIGNHSYSHLKGFRTATDVYLEDVKLAARFLKTKLFRPPYGRIRVKQAKRIANYFHLVMWDVLSHDYNRKISAEKCCRNVVNFVQPGSIIVFHDSEKAAPNMLEALPKTLETLTKQGYKFEVIPYEYGK